jgi:hypothetical protein
MKDKIRISREDERCFNNFMDAKHALYQLLEQFLKTHLSIANENEERRRIMWEHFAETYNLDITDKEWSIKFDKIEGGMVITEKTVADGEDKY